ncbi:MAG: acylphosphatase [Erysipelotrichaceae bacterium]|nr:acylphosphatase [Erysipelotrichaceae bacterium]
MKKIRRHFRFHGIVQGVGFRFTAAMAAEQLGLTGWVKNEYDGTVSMEIQGTEEEIDRVIDMIEASRFIRIERTDVMDLPVREDESSFSCGWY